VIRPAADRDLDELSEFYAVTGGEALVTQFLLAVCEAIGFIRENPACGSPRFLDNARLAGLRSWPIPGFDDIRLYYLHAEPDLVRIIRVLHGKRDLNAILMRDELE